MLKKLKKVAKKILIGDKQQKHFLLLEKQPRYTKGNFLYQHRKITFPDAQSFCFTFKELFISHVYKFQTSSHSPVIIDCGANIGLSIIYFKQLYPNARIIAFEPDKIIFNYLEENIKSFELNNVTLINKGLWSHEAKLEFFNEGSDANRILRNFEKDSAKSVSVIETVQLSKFLNEKIDFLKIDIEGAETEVITEIESKLVFVKNIFIEYHSFSNKKQDLFKILEILTNNNFHYYLDVPNRIKKFPFIDENTFLSMDFLLNIYARKIND